jgi:YidC/Oxa1 family membrane protein insertase
MKSLSKAIGGLFQPLLDLVGDILAFFYSIIPIYPIDVALLTIVIMAALTPLTIKSTKNMAAMQALGPEMKKIQQKYKGADNRAQLNEEMMKLYKEHNVNPASGCLPMLLQMPAFLILYDVIRGITNTVPVAARASLVGGRKVIIPSHIKANPRYIGHATKMFHDITHAKPPGSLNAFGMDFGEKLLSHHKAWWLAVPYLLLVVGSVGLQYLQMSRLNARNPQAAQANPQAAMMQKYMPLIFGFIYLNVAAIINIYFVFSSAIRIGTQEVLFRKGIVAGPPAPSATPSKSNSSTRNGSTKSTAERELPKPKSSPGSSVKANGRSNGTSGKSTEGTSSNRKSPSDAQVAKARSSSAKNGNGQAKSSSRTSTSSSDKSRDEPKPKEHPRSKAKRERRAR